MSTASLTRFQIGWETTRGTAVAATRPMYMQGELPQEERPPEYITQERGDFNEYHDSIQTHIKAGWEAEGVFNYKEAPVWMKLALQGGIEPDDVAAPYLWSADSQSTSDDLDSITLEARDDVATVRMPFGMVDSWEIAGSDGKGPKAITHKMTFIGSKVEHATPTAAPTAIDLRGSYAHFTQARIYIDGTAGNIGTTEWSNALMAFSLKGENKLSPNYTGGGAMSYTSIGRGERHIEVMFDLLLNATLYSEWQNAFKGNTGRFGQLKFEGAGNDDFIFNFYTKWESNEFQRGDGTRRVVIMGKTQYDPTLGYAWQANLYNDVDAV